MSLGMAPQTASDENSLPIQRNIEEMKDKRRIMDGEKEREKEGFKST